MTEKIASNAASGKRQGLRTARQEADPAGQAVLGHERSGFLQVERVHVDRGDRVGAAKTVRQQSVERAGTAPDIEDRLARPGAIMSIRVRNIAR